MITTKALPFCTEMNNMDFVIDCAQISAPPDFHSKLRDTLGFPSYYGNNLDALYDCLTSITQKTTIHLQNINMLPKHCKGFLLVFNEAEENNDVLYINYE